MADKMSTIRGKYESSLPVGPSTADWPVKEKSDDDCPAEYRNNPALAELGWHLRQFGKVCGIRVDLNKSRPSIVFRPRLDRSDENRWMVCCRAVRLFVSAVDELKMFNQQHEGS